VIRRIEFAPGEETGPPEKTPPETALKFKLVMLFSWVLAATLLACLAGVFILILAGKTVPDFIPPIITAVIGYFGGAICAYFGLRT